MSEQLSILYQQVILPERSFTGIILNLVIWLTTQYLWDIHMISVNFSFSLNVIFKMERKHLVSMLQLLENVFSLQGLILSTVPPYFNHLCTLISCFLL